MPIKRRRYLAAVGTTLAVAGCSGTAGTPTGSETPTGPPADADTPTDATPDDTMTPVPGDRFGDEPCPSFTETDHTVCWHTRGETDIWLEPEGPEFVAAAGNDTVETISFTLHNERTEPFRLNPYAWALQRRERDGWHRVAPEQHIEPLETVPPGGTYTWVLSRQPHPRPESERTLSPTIEVENGRHAFTVDGWFGEQETTVECLALFDVQLIYADPGETPTPP
jgi:hypothetical protein